MTINRADVVDISSGVQRIIRKVKVVAHREIIIEGVSSCFFSSFDKKCTSIPIFFHIPS